LGDLKYGSDDAAETAGEGRTRHVYDRQRSEISSRHVTRTTDSVQKTMPSQEVTTQGRGPIQQSAVGHVNKHSGLLQATPRTAAILSDRLQVQENTSLSNKDVDANIELARSSSALATAAAAAAAASSSSTGILTQADILKQMRDIFGYTCLKSRLYHLHHHH
jgi:hypothetical protein